MISNVQGQVALVHIFPIPKLVRIGEKGYVFVNQHSVSLCWVDLEDVSKVLAIKGGCCGGEKPVFRYASERQIQVWTTGHY